MYFVGIYPVRSIDTLHPPPEAFRRKEVFWQNLRTLTLRKVLSDHFSLNNISELIPIINVALIYSFF